MKIIEVSSTSVKYKKLDNIDGPIFEIPKSDILMLKYSNGTREVVKTEATSPQNLSCYSAQEDARVNYRKKGFSGGGTFLVSTIAGPLLGLIPAIICSSSTPRESKWGVPNQENMKTNEYRICYKNKVRSLKSKRVWTGWGIGLAINLVAAGVLILAGGAY